MAAPNRKRGFPAMPLRGGTTKRSARGKLQAGARGGEEIAGGHGILQGGIQVPMGKRGKGGRGSVTEERRVRNVSI